MRKDALEKYPELQGVLEKLNGLISEDEMQQLNYEGEVNGTFSTIFTFALLHPRPSAISCCVIGHISALLISI